MRVQQYTIAICKVCKREFKKRTKKGHARSKDIRSVAAVTCSKECSRKNVRFLVDKEAHRKYTNWYYHNVLKKKHAKHKEL